VQFVWAFVARTDRVEAFERAYANSGPWAQLFPKSGGFYGTTLLPDSEDACRHLTIDRWQSAAAPRQMRQQFATEYEMLDRECEAFTEDERRIGIFEEV
jgi:hypothetical protein